MKGTVKWFNVQKGFGFIAGEDGKDYFVHGSQIPNNEELKENDNVIFTAFEGDRGPQAQKVEFDQ